MVNIQKDIFETILYTDQSLKEFFDQYKKRPDFDNTIFIITGDHAMPELNITYISLLGRYHVPLIIYSRLLKKPVWFQSVSSHLDITPSILAMLKSYGDFTVPTVCHWLGKGIDVTENFTSSRTLSFTYNNGLQPDYLDKEYFYSFDRLYHVLPGLKLHRVYDTKISERLKMEQQDYITVTDEAVLKKKFVPEDLFYGWNYLMEPYQAAKAVKYDKTKTSEYYISLISYNKMIDDPQFLKIDLSMLIKIPSGDSTRIPQLVFNVLDDNIQNHKWIKFRFDRKDLPGNSYQLHLKQYVDLSEIDEITSKTLKMYLINEYQEEIILDSLNLQLTSMKHTSKQKASPVQIQN